VFRLLRILPIAALILLLAAGLVQASFQTITGPSSSQSPYVVPVADGVRTVSLLTVGDSVNNEPDGSPYRLVGIPDGLGAFDNGDGTFTLLMNHELQNTVGAVRARGAKGAFVSKWILSKDTLQVLHGEDLIQQVATWNPQAGQYNPPAKGVVISRLWRLNFRDPADPMAGGTIDMLLSGGEGQKMMDNLAVTTATPQLFRGGQTLIQEDPGNQPHIAKVWRYNNLTGSLELIAQHDPDRFAPGAPNFLTQDEESSGIIDVSDILGRGWVLLDVQAHYNIGDPELVEGGQLLALFLPPRQRFP
jgi:hypothetical protein